MAEGAAGSITLSVGVDTEPAKKGLGRLKDMAASVAAGFKSMAGRLGESLSGMGQKLQGVFSGVGSALGSLAGGLLRGALRQGLQWFMGEMGRIMNSNEEFRAQLAQLKAALYTLIAPLMSALVPAIQVVVQWLTAAAVAVGRFIAAITGGNYEQMTAAAKATKEQADAYAASEKSSGKVAKNAAKTAKEAKGALASFDQLNTMSKDAEEAGGGVGGISVDNPIEDVDPFAGVAEFDTGPIKEKLDEVMGWVGIALAAVGVILLFFGVIPAGIGCIIAGLVFWAINTTGQYSEAGVEDPVKEMLSDLMEAVGLALAVIGVILLFFGNIGWGIAAIIAGIGLFIAGEATSDEGSVGNMIKKFFQENAALITGASIFMIVIGVLLCCGGLIPQGAALIAAGAIGLVGTIAMNWDAIVSKIKDIGSKIGAVFVKLWEGIKAGFKAMVNGIIWYANLWIKGLNAILLPIRALIVAIANAFGKNVSLEQIRIPEIPKLAKGGVVPYATTAVIGEAGAEAVLPLERNTEWMDTLADKLASRMPTVPQDNRPIVLEVDGREIARANRGGENGLGRQTVTGRFTNVI